MEWIEIIRMRGQSPPERTSLIGNLHELLLQANEAGLTQFKICSCPDKRDLLVLLHWDRPFGPKTGKSHLGEVVATEMARFGLVDHSMWHSVWHSITTHKYDA